MQPFARAKSMMAAIAALLAAGVSHTQAVAEVIAKNGAYKSRGKGIGKFTGRRVPQVRSVYMPHQGPRECARRVAQRFA